MLGRSVVKAVGEVKPPASGHFDEHLQASESILFNYVKNNPRLT